MFRKRGFTIIELLIAVSITALILGIIYSSYFSTMRTMEASKTGIKSYKMGRIVLDKIGRDLSGIYFLSRDKQTRFQGESDKLSFISTNCLEIAEEEDLCAVEYLLGEDKSGKEKTALGLKFSLVE